MIHRWPFCRRQQLILNKLNLIMSQLDDLNSELTTLKTELDAAKGRDGAIQGTLAEVQKKLDDLLAAPPVDLTAAIQAIKDDVAEAQTIGQPPAAPAV